MINFNEFLSLFSLFPELLAHLSDDDRDRGLRKPKSSGFFGNFGRRSIHPSNHDDVFTNVRTTRGRSIPVPVNKQQLRQSVRQQHVDVDLVELLAEQLCLSQTGGGGGYDKGQKERDRRLLQLNDSSVQLLLHEDPEEAGTSSSNSSCGSVSSGDEEVHHHRNDEDVILPLIDDLVVGSKFARQLSKSHSVVVEEQQQGNNSIVFEGAKKKKKKKTQKKNGSGDDLLTPRIIVEVDDDTTTDDDEELHQYHRRGPKASSVAQRSLLALPESPTRFCFIDGTNQVSVRDTVLRYCDQTEPLRFADVYSERVLRQCRKVGEGVYSEVFMYRQFPVDAANANDSVAIEGKAIVLKVIPIEGALIVNGEVQKKFDEILSEIIISKELSDLRYDGRNKTNGFVNVERVRCVKGRYPSYLVDLWDLYNDNHGSDNDHPEVFDDEQLFIVLELENAGQDLEAFNFNNAVQGHAAFLQVRRRMVIIIYCFRCFMIITLDFCLRLWMKWKRRMCSTKGG